MRLEELSSQHPYALSFQESIHVRDRNISGLPVTGLMWTTGHAIRSNVLNSTAHSPISQSCLRSVKDRQLQTCDILQCHNYGTRIFYFLLFWWWEICRNH